MTSNSPAPRPPIAVVGVSALFPGSVDATGFWHDILSGADRMTEVPSTHWLIDDHYDADPSVPDRTYGRRGGFLDPIDFDAMGFGVPPSVVPSTDTSQLLALIVAQRVLDDATRGQFSELDRSRASVILGVTSGQELFGAMASRMNRPMWLQGMRRAGIAEDVAQQACDRILDLHPEWTESTFPGLLGNVVAGRIANRLDLGGTNCVTDAACASSFSAISMGINELYLGDSDLVIAGGVDTMNDIFMYMCFSKTPALSKTEDIRPFSDQADGTMLGEGIGMVALKRLEDAERDGNDIYCVVNGVGASSDGRSKSVYAPVSSGQARALSNAYDKAGYGPDTVELVEAHGTGTVAGDAAEFGGLSLAFDATERADRQWCALGSVKSQIGHTKAAAGAAGLFKVVMALHHKVLPQTAKIESPNPELNLTESPFHLNTQTRPWVRSSENERRASVSSFGFGGSNFHIALSEYTGSGAKAPRLRTADTELVVLSAPDAPALVALAADHSAAATAAGYLSWVAQTSQQTFQADAAVRLSVVATDEAELRTKLDQAVAAINAAPDQSASLPGGIHYGVGPSDGDIAFVFPGQGSQYVSMGADVAMSFDVAMDAWDLAADQHWDDSPLQDVVFPITSFEDGADKANKALLTATHWAQPAIGTASLSLLRLLTQLGISADHVAGHSFGEVTALHAAGALSEADLIRVARQRGVLMAEAAQTPGSMTAVASTIDEVRDIVGRSDANVVVANHNSHQQVVLSGPTPDVEKVEADIKAAGLRATRLPVATAFHSSVVSGASDAFGEFLADVEVAAPTIPVYSNETAAPYPAGDASAMRAQLARQLANPVRFVEMIEAMHDEGARTFIEVGPSSTLTGLVSNVLDGRPHIAVPLDNRRRAGLGPLLDGLGRLAAAGHAISFDALWAGYGNMSNPHDAIGPKLALPIGGSNYESPYPPADLNDLAEANPVTMTPAPGATTEVHALGAPPTADPVAMPTPAPTAAASPTADAAVLAAYQSAQEQTAAAHAAYLNTMAQAHSAFLAAAQQGIAALGQLAGGLPTPLVPGAQVVAPAPVATTMPAPTVASAPAVNAIVPVAPSTPTPVPASSAVPVQTPAPAAVPTTAPAPVGGVDASEMEPLLLAVVSDRTGYPAEMLSREMDLESDLGIDSIKRVEILSAMETQVPNLPEVDLQVMSKLATLGEITDYLASQLDSSTTAYGTEPAAAPSPPTQLAPAVGRYVTRSLPVTAPGSETPQLRRGPIHVTDEGTGVADALIPLLREQGIDAVPARPDPAGAGGLIHLGSLRGAGDVDTEMRSNQEAFLITQTYAGQLGDGGVFAVVSDRSAALDTNRRWGTGLPALARTARLEWPATTVRSLDLERAGRSADAIAGAIAAELLGGGADEEVHLAADETRTVSTTIELDVEAGSLGLGRQDVIVVSGGARGVTAAATMELARVTGATFVLLGRSELTDEPGHYGAAADDAALKQLILRDAQAAGEIITPADLDQAARRILAAREIRATVASIEFTGASAQYLAVDITDAAAVESALADVRSSIGPITAVIHGAGVLADKLIVDKTAEQFAHVFDTKVRGLRNLLDSTAGDNLKVLCLFSSVAAHTGNVGQSDYAMANEVLNMVARSEQARRGSTCTVKALGWGPWAGGMVTPSLKRHFEGMGVPLIPIDVGAKMMVAELAAPPSGDAVVVLGGGVLAPSTERPVNA